MSFYELVSPFVDGEAVGAVFVGDEPPDDPSGPVVEHYPDPEIYVWSAGDNALRLRSGDESLARAKSVKEIELRDWADNWYQENVRAFEGTVIAAKYGRVGITALNAEEQQIFNLMNSNYTRLKSLIQSVRQATTIEQVQAIVW